MTDETGTNTAALRALRNTVPQLDEAIGSLARNPPPSKEAEAARLRDLWAHLRDEIDGEFGLDPTPEGDGS